MSSSALAIVTAAAKGLIARLRDGNYAAYADAAAAAAAKGLIARLRDGNCSLPSASTSRRNG